MHIVVNEQNVGLEPKVFAVLLYLFDNKDRYVSVSELHDNLWNGTLVCDAAVRRCISKLRQVLSDNPKEPRFIRSTPKRGYKLVCHVNFVDEEIPVHIEALNEHTHETAKQRLSKVSYIHAKVIVACAIAIILFLGTVSVLIFVEKPEDIQIIQSLPGDKVAIAKSRTGKLAYAGSLSQKDGYQIFYASDGINTVPISSDAHFPISLSFSNDEKKLYFIDLIEGNSSLNSVSIEDQKVDVLLRDYYLISDLVNVEKDNALYFTGTKFPSEPIVLNRYDTTTKEVSPVTFSPNKELNDLQVAVSPSAEKIAVVRFDSFQNRYDIRVLDRRNNKRVFGKVLDDAVFDVQWVNENEIIYSSSLGLHKLHLINASSELVVADEKLGIFTYDQLNNSVIAIGRKKSEALYYERELPVSNFETTRILKLEDDTIQMFDSNADDARIVIIERDNVNEINKVDLQGNHSKPLYASDSQLTGLMGSGAEPIFLFLEGNQLVYLDYENSSIERITSSDIYVGDATLSNNGEYVYFTTKGENNWELVRHKVGSGENIKLLDNFKYVRTMGNRLVVVKESGEMYLLNLADNNLENLNRVAILSGNTFWDVIGNSVIWSEHDLVDVSFFQLDLSNVEQPELTKTQFSYQLVKPKFSVLKKEMKVVLRSDSGDSSELLSIPL
ncbi:winged helix-turn-helix domain-containing protein [Pseudoalteromonas xiamenensis]|uniref:winged helix-turn-helix domain-containing protein n=1 Tax=Pseudoalteromonas xiamenensis TaxID=882626 RepID=UPI0027E4216C|nr:winged helix-turn-helix domain-containing protein [Pseudoalteromonas xiamenensis]WMN60558.1 winged helix-turn-helix domain-containing protein [Pseudoalteromonas xiamenensis]